MPSSTSGNRLAALHKHSGLEMIVSHRHKFIFVKTGKTGGSSVEMQLSLFCGPEDIVTPGMEAKDPKYAQFLESRRPRNLRIPLHRAAYVSLPIPPFVPLEKHHRPRVTFYDHMPAFRIQRGLPKKIWNEYFKFTVVRNPYDRAISQYFWNNRKTSDHTKERVNDYILHKIPPVMLTNWFMYASGQNVLVDHFIRYEELESGLRATLDRLGIKEPLALPDAKAGLRPRTASHRDYLNPAARAYVEKHAKAEIDYFGYEW
ncbi:sulfotransferase family 2 domain-containing protein [Hyphomicrobium facile]|nr:sulfotransferase family 2 domain-containing protein [Hyphomicrobium facile]